MSKGKALIAAVQRGSQMIKGSDAAKVAGRVETTFGVAPPKTRAGVITAISNIVRNNPGKATIAATLLAELGIDVAMDAAQDYLSSEEYSDVGDGGAIAAAYAAARKTVLERMETNVGDGETNKVAGIAESDFDENLGVMRQQFDMIEGVLPFFGGSLETFERVRAALFGVEPKAITAYRTLNRRR